MPRTKEALKSLAALDCSGRVLVVVTHDDDAVERSFRNVPGVQTMSGDQVTAYDLLAADVVVFTDETLPGSTSTGPPPTSSASAAKVAPKKAPATAPARERSATEERGEQ